MVGEDNALALVAGVMTLVLVASALFGRGIGLGSLIRMVAGWAAIFAVVMLLVATQQQWGGPLASLLSDQRVEGSELVLTRAPDGHFYADAMANGVPVTFMVDTGATITAINASDADRANVARGGLAPVILNTANGTVTAERGTVGRLAIESLATDDLGVVVSDRFGRINVLGMNFLNRLAGWRVEGNRMILEPEAG